MGLFKDIQHSKSARLAFVLSIPVLLSACLYLDIGTALSLKRMDPYTVDLVNSRAAILLPPTINYAQTVSVTVRVTRNETVLQEELFALEVVEDEEDLPGIDLAQLYRRPLIVRLAKADYRRANALQTRLAILDKNHKWVEPGSETVKSNSGTKTSEPQQRAIADDEDASGDLTIAWQFSFSPAGIERHCARKKKVRLTGWVKVNDDAQYRRVVHGLPLKKIFGKKGMKQLCSASEKLLNETQNEST